jgi:hypothetical protein
LPPFIDNLINDKLPKDYKYDYFKEHPDENIFYRHICFNADILYSLIINANKIKDNINVKKIALEKLIKKIGFLENLKKTNEGSVKKDIKFFLISDTINSEAYKKILKIKREKKYFSLKEIKHPETQADHSQNNLIKIKNFFFSFLYNSPTLNINNYSKVNKNDIIEILKEIRNNADKNPYIYSEQNMAQLNPLFDSLMQNLPLLEQRQSSGNVVLEEKLTGILNILKDIKEKTLKKAIDQNQYQKPIPIKWFLGSLIEFLPKLPKEYIQNNYEKLLKELELDINNSIKQLDFEFVGNTIDHIREIEKKKNYYQNVKDIIIDIDLNKKANEIIERHTIPVNIIFDYEAIELDIEPIKAKKKSIFSSLIGDNSDDQKDAISCNNIKTFAEKFPDLTVYESLHDINMLEIIEKMKLPSKLEKYFNIIKDYIKEYIKQKKLIDNNNFEDINNKIYDYIMEQLNDKLFPKEISSKDSAIFKNYVKLCWIQPKHLIPMNKEYILDYYLPDAITYFQRINEEKSPRKKFICLKELFNCIYNLGKFNEDKVEGMDAELNLLSYTFVKAKTPNIYNNCKYMSLFLGDKKYNIEENQLDKITSLCDYYEKFSFENVSNITESEYLENIDLAIKGVLKE